MSLVKTSFLNAIAVGIRMLTMLGLNKLLAVYVGPAGYALFGQFQNAITMITTFASGAINTGVTKYTAQYHDDAKQQERIWGTAGRISISMALIASAFIAIFHEHLAQSIFQSQEHKNVLLWLAATLVLFVLNSLLMAILNGKKAINYYVLANISTSIATLLLTWLLTQRLGLDGALIALAVNQSLVFFISLILCLRCNWFKWRYLFTDFDQVYARKLAAYGLMAMVTAIAVPWSQILIREQLMQDFGQIQAGMWQAVTKMSDVYLMLITTTLTVYYLPRLSEIKLGIELRQEVFKVYRFILPLTALGALLVYLLKDWLVLLLFTREFQAMNDLLGWQLIGDVIKIGSWVLGFIMLGRAMTKAYIATEIIFSFSLVILTWWCTQQFGLVGSVIAFAINYLLYWATIALILYKQKVFQET
jgi:PST family polysaccharide transporter